MAVANPITSKVQTIAMHRDGAYWKLEQLPDLITCDDPFFRPVGLTNGPDGCIYITDWYNKIISHNEVPRAHPDRDKTRGRIWRIKPKGTKLEVPDFTQASVENLLAMLGTRPTAKAHLAWQALADHGLDNMGPDAGKILAAKEESIGRFIQNQSAPPEARVQALWAAGAFYLEREPLFQLQDQNPHVRRAILGKVQQIAHDTHEACFPQYPLATSAKAAALLKQVAAHREVDPAVRRDLICFWGESLFRLDSPLSIENLLGYAQPSLPGPLGQSSRGAKQIPVREAYDREFERFLVRMFLERHPERVALFLDSDAAAKLPLEARVLASLSLEPKTSAARVAKLLPQLDRAPNEEELLRLAQFPEEPGVGDALKALLTNEASRAAVIAKLRAQRTKLDVAQLQQILRRASGQMVKSNDAATRRQGLELAIDFQCCPEEVFDPVMDRQAEVFAKKLVPADKDGEMALRLRAMAAVRSGDAQVFYVLAELDPDAGVREAALDALIASSTNVVQSACERLFKLYPKLDADQRKRVLSALSGQAEGGAEHLLTAVLDKTVPASDLDASHLERLASVLGGSPDMERLQKLLGGRFKEVLLLDGQDTAWVDSKITLEGPFTIESWVRLAPNIGNGDSLLGSPGKLDLNFFASKFRVWIGEKGLHDVCVSTKPMTPDLWTHLAVTRDEHGVFRIYQNGELDATGTKTYTAKIEDCRIGWSGPKTGTEGALCEFRVWKKARTAAEIRANFDRSGLTDPTDLAKLGKGARLAKTLDAPPLLTEAQAKALDAKFAKLSALAGQGNAQAGKALSALCIACHQIGNTGGQIGPNLSGVGAMGLEAVLRNILTPNAAMEPGYRIYRVEMKNGDLIDAFFVSEDKAAVIIRQPGLQDRRVDKKDIRSTKFIRRSLMPEGLLDALPDQSAADLLAYLMTLKG